MEDGPGAAKLDWDGWVWIQILPLSGLLVFLRQVASLSFCFLIYKMGTGKLPHRIVQKIRQVAGIDRRGLCSTLPLYVTASRLHIIIGNPFAMAKLAGQQNPTQQAFQGPSTCQILFYSLSSVLSVSASSLLLFHCLESFSPLFPPVLFQPVQFSPSYFDSSGWMSPLPF